jgi:hypothetical protein
MILVQKGRGGDIPLWQRQGGIYPSGNAATVQPSAKSSRWGRIWRSRGIGSPKAMRAGRPFRASLLTRYPRVTVPDGGSQC